MKLKSKYAFTLIELLIVIAIITILALIAIPNLLESQIRTKVSAVKSDHRVMVIALEAYVADYNKYPPAPQPFLNPTVLTETWRLTTPIAYTTVIPKDIFFKPQSFGEPGGKFGPGGSYMHYMADPLVTEVWLIWSYGPDQDLEFAQISYDPTNGTVSNGDIYRVGSLP